MKKLGRPKKNPSEIKVTVAFYISKPNQKKIITIAKEKKISKSLALDNILDEVTV